MAMRYRTASGVWSDATKWDGVVSLPGTGDDVYANNFTCTVDIDVTVANFYSTASGPAAAGGTFALSSGVTATGHAWSGSGNCITMANPSTLIGDTHGSSTAPNSRGANITGFGTHIGNSYGGSQTNANGTVISNGRQYGNSYAGSGSGAYGTNLTQGATQVGDSHGGATSGVYGTLVQGGAVQIGDSFGGSAATAYGSLVTTGGSQCGECNGGSHATAYGSIVQSGGWLVAHRIVDSTGKGLTLGNDGIVILWGDALQSQINITAVAGRYNIGRGTLDTRSFVRPPLHVGFVS
jgi:hypothetical protein